MCSVSAVDLDFFLDLLEFQPNSETQQSLFGYADVPGTQDLAFRKEMCRLKVRQCITSYSLSKTFWKVENPDFPLEEAIISTIISLNLGSLSGSILSAWATDFPLEWCIIRIIGSL